MKRGKCKYTIKKVETTDENNLFTLVFINTKVSLWKDDSSFRTTMYKYDVPDDIDRQVFSLCYIKVGSLSDREHADLRAAHKRTTFKVVEIRPPVVTHVYDVAYRHKERMWFISFPRQDADGRWYYLIAADVPEDYIRDHLSDSARDKKRSKTCIGLNHD
jgi:hypothetical protein